MKIEIPFLGKTKDHYLQEGINTYCSRLSHYTAIEIKQIKVKRRGGQNKKENIIEESRLIDRHISAGSYRMVLDSSGTMMSSEQLSEHLRTLENRGVKQLAVIIGGPAGIDRGQLERADLILSLSKCTFTHDMVRLLILEQLYRAYTIKAGEQYHK